MLSPEDFAGSLAEVQRGRQVHLLKHEAVQAGLVEERGSSIVGSLLLAVMFSGCNCMATLEIVVSGIQGALLASVVLGGVS